MKKIVVTGASGFLARRIVQLHQDEYLFLTPTHDELDITDKEKCLLYMETHRPDVVIHCAAISNMVACEQNPIESQLVNVDGTIHIALACQAVGAKMIFASSDQVYNGSQTDNLGLETDSLMPSNLYGNQKLTAEKSVIEIAAGVCLRLPWMCDRPSENFPDHPDFYSNLMNCVAEKETLYYSPYDMRSITNVNHVAQNIFKCFDLPGGTYNFAATGNYSAYYIAYHVIRKLYPDRPDLWDLIQPSKNATPETGRNITMDMGKIMSQNVLFPDSIDSILQLNY